MTPLMDQLESRSLMSASLVNGTLTINGTQAADVIEIDRKTLAQLKVSINNVESKYNFASINKIIVNGFNGNDLIEVNTRNIIPQGVEIHGGNGKDIIEGSNGPDKIWGDANSDLIEGRAGNDTIFGGGGNDRIQGQDGNDAIAGGTGNDKIQGGNGRDNLSGNDGEDDLEGNAGIDTLLGGASNDDFLDLLAGEANDKNAGDNGANSLI